MKVVEKNHSRRKSQEVLWLFDRWWEDVALQEFNSSEVHEVCKGVVFLRVVGRWLCGQMIASKAGSHQKKVKGQGALPAFGLYGIG